MPRFEALEVLLARAEQTRLEKTSFHECIVQQFDVNAKTPECIAAVCRYADSGKRDNKIWMCFSPVFLHADKDRLLLQGQSMLAVTEQEAARLIGELNSLYKEDGWLFESHHPERWYASIDSLPDALFSHYLEVLGRSIESFLPQGQERIEWHRVVNEIQMLLHASEVNQQRLEKSCYPINSVWCWGGGQLPDTVRSDWNAVYTDDIFCKGLVQLAGGVAKALPEHVDELFDAVQQCEPGKEMHQLVVMQQTEEDILSLDFTRYLQKLASLEDKWFKPLLRQLGNGRCKSLTLLAGNGIKYYLEKKHLRRFWKRPKAI